MWGEFLTMRCVKKREKKTVRKKTLSTKGIDPDSKSRMSPSPVERKGVPRKLMCNLSVSAKKETSCLENLLACSKEILVEGMP